MPTCLVLLALLALPTPDYETRTSWNAAHPPFKIHGSTYYVGSRGLTSILIASEKGHVLIDAGLPESAPLIAANVRQLGYQVEDIEWILLSHPHFDHAGGIAEIQQASGAAVYARSAAAAVLEAGRSGRDDPQYGVAAPFPGVTGVRRLADRETLELGDTRLTGYATGGHTPGGTSWTWRSCEGEACVHVVYADSLTAVSADGFRFTDGGSSAPALAEFERSFRLLGELPCDILLTPHPSASSLLSRAKSGSFVEEDACRSYVQRAREALNRRIGEERAGRR